jgi:uncharacterized membrane protein YuzA (DUF378 family)
MDLFPNATPNGMYINKKIYMVIFVLVLIGGINWLIIGFMGSDPVRNFLSRRWASYLHIVIGVAALLLVFRRDVYLPFLGETLVPAGAIMLKTPQGANESVTIKTRPGAKVIYWATEPNPNGSDKVVAAWNDAYKNFENSGVVQAAEDGVAILRIRGPPQPYKVPMKGTLKAHVHFRVENPYGMFGRVQIVYLGSGTIEGFANSL